MAAAAAMAEMERVLAPYAPPAAGAAYVSQTVSLLRERAAAAALVAAAAPAALAARPGLQSALAAAGWTAEAGFAVPPTAEQLQALAQRVRLATGHTVVVAARGQLRHTLACCTGDVSVLLFLGADNFDMPWGNRTASDLVWKAHSEAVAAGRAPAPTRAQIEAARHVVVWATIKRRTAGVALLRQLPAQHAGRLDVSIVIGWRLAQLEPGSDDAWLAACSPAITGFRLDSRPVALPADGLRRFPRLDELALVNGEVTELPEPGSRLRVLNLKHCRGMLELPAWLGRCSDSLTELHMPASCCSWTQGLGELTQLRQLALTENRTVTCLPGLPATLASLFVLTLSCTKLTALPAGIGHLT